MFQIGVEILLKDTSGGAGPADEAQIDASLKRAPAHGRGGERLLAPRKGAARNRLAVPFLAGAAEVGAGFSVFGSGGVSLPAVSAVALSSSPVGLSAFG